jgi:hypothetical protein
LCIAFNDRQSLTPEHVWLIPAHIVNSKVLLGIPESRLDAWNTYERSIEKVISLCEVLRSS